MIKYEIQITGNSKLDEVSDIIRFRLIQFHVSTEICNQYAFLYLYNYTKNIDILITEVVKMREMIKIVHIYE